MPTPTFDQALSTLITAIARYRRCGPGYVRKSKAYWTFLAGTYDEKTYEALVKSTVESLPELRSVEYEVRVARELVVDAVRLLGGVHERDSVDLAEAMELFDQY